MLQHGPNNVYNFISLMKQKCHNFFCNEYGSLSSLSSLTGSFLMIPSGREQNNPSEERWTPWIVWLIIFVNVWFVSLCFSFLYLWSIQTFNNSNETFGQNTWLVHPVLYIIPHQDTHKIWLAHKQWIWILFTLGIYFNGLRVLERANCSAKSSVVFALKGYRHLLNKKL